jgi:anti-anti-sigma regulatory factor
VWLTERRFANAAILDVHGALAGPAAGELLQSTTRTQVKSGVRIVILNLTDVGVLDDEGIKTVYGIAESTRQRGAEVRIAGDLGRIAHLGAVRPMVMAFRTFATVDDALEDIRAALEQRHARVTTSRLTRWLAMLRDRLFTRD